MGQLKKLSHTKTSISSLDILDNAKNLTPIAETLHLNLMYECDLDTYALLPKHLRCVCLDLIVRVDDDDNIRYLINLPKELRSLILRISAKKCCSARLFANFHVYFPKLDKLDLEDYSLADESNSIDGEPILSYLRSAKLLKELRLDSERFNDIELSDFYESRETKLALKIYYGGETIVHNKSPLKLLNVPNDPDN